MHGRLRPLVLFFGAILYTSFTLEQCIRHDIMLLVSRAAHGTVEPDISKSISVKYSFMRGGRTYAVARSLDSRSLTAAQ